MKPAESSGPGGPEGTIRTMDPGIPASERFSRAAAHLTRKLGDDSELLLGGLASASSADFLAYLQSNLDVAFAFVSKFVTSRTLRTVG